MKDMERELRELGARARDTGAGAGSLSGAALRRIRLRRALFAAAGAVTTIALVATASFGLGLARDGGIPPAEDPSSTLIRFERSGGFTGDHHVLTIERDGSAVFEFPGSRGLVEPEKFELQPDVMADLENAVDGVDWAGLDEQRTLTNVAVADGYVIEMSHDGYNVITESASEPPSARPLIHLLNGIIEARLNGPIGAEPSLILSETEVRPGDVVELGIRAHENYTWGVLTSLEAERDGGWRRAGYWRTWPGKGPRILEAITTSEGTIEAIGFGGSGDFKLKIPQLEPGTYRITKEFVAPAGPGSLGRTIQAEVRFEVFGDERSTSPQDFSAIWPEDTYEDAREACDAAAREDADEEEGEENVVSIRSDPQSVILEFGYEVLGWDQAQTFRPRLDIPSERTVYGLRRGHGRGASPRDPEVIVSVEEVQPGCWSVRSVSRMPDREPTGVGIGVEGREVIVGFDTLRAAGGIVEVGYAEMIETEGWVAADAIEQPVRLLLDSRPATTGHFLILFEDEDGRVFSASGGPLPAGDFAAG